LSYRAPQDVVALVGYRRNPPQPSLQKRKHPQGVLP
jgi:hypothetical protein